MNRTPHPKCAAQRIRAYLSKDGIDLSQRKALDLVALAAGYNSWQTMSAATRDQPQPAPVLSAYEQMWNKVAPALRAEMQSLAELLRPALRTGLTLHGPELAKDDEYRFFLQVDSQVKASATDCLLWAEFSLIEDEATPGRYALKFFIEDYHDELIWVSGVNFSDHAWMSTAEELLEALTHKFSSSDVMAAINERAYFRDSFA